MGKLTDEERAARPHLFKKGQSGNPLGASREVMLRNHENARKATRLREKFLDTLESRIATIEVLAEREASGLGQTEADAVRTQRVMALLNSDVNRLLTDSESRGLGAPRQPLEIEDRRERRLEDYSDEELLAIAMGDEEQEALPAPSEDE